MKEGHRIVFEEQRPPKPPKQKPDRTRIPERREKPAQRPPKDRPKPIRKEGS